MESVESKLSTLKQSCLEEKAGLKEETEELNALKKSLLILEDRLKQQTGELKKERELISIANQKVQRDRVHHDRERACFAKQKETWLKEHTEHKLKLSRELALLKRNKQQLEASRNRFTDRKRALSARHQRECNELSQQWKGVQLTATDARRHKEACDQQRKEISRELAAVVNIREELAREREEIEKQKWDLARKRQALAKERAEIDALRKLNLAQTRERRNYVKEVRALKPVKPSRPRRKKSAPKSNDFPSWMSDTDIWPTG